MYVWIPQRFFLTITLKKSVPSASCRKKCTCNAVEKQKYSKCVCTPI